MNKESRTFWTQLTDQEMDTYLDSAAVLEVLLENRREFYAKHLDKSADYQAALEFVKEIRKELSETEKISRGSRRKFRKILASVIKKESLI